MRLRLPLSLLLLFLLSSCGQTHRFKLDRSDPVGLERLNQMAAIDFYVEYIATDRTQLEEYGYDLKAGRDSTSWHVVESGELRRIPSTDLLKVEVIRSSPNVWLGAGIGAGSGLLIAIAFSGLWETDGAYIGLPLIFGFLGFLITAFDSRSYIYTFYD